MQFNVGYDMLGSCAVIPIAGGNIASSRIEVESTETCATAHAFDAEEK